MIDDPIDFSPLDPLGDSPALEARVAAIARAALIPPEPDLVAALAAWARPALAAAAVIASIAIYSVVQQPPPRRVTTAEILGVPTAVVELARLNAPPGVVDLAEALDAEPAHGR